MERIHKPSSIIRGKRGQDSVFSQISPVVLGLIFLVVLLIIIGIIFRKKIPGLLDGIWNWLTFGGG